MVAGVGYIGAGAVLQENVFISVFLSPEQARALAAAMGTPDLTATAFTNSVVAGGFRALGSYALGWALVLWGTAALRGGRLPRALSWLGIVAGVLFALTNWIGPLVGPFAFVGLLVWHGWLGGLLLGRRTAPLPAAANA